jgi:hypothetical protein
VKKYTEQAKKIFKDSKAPYKGLVVDMVEYPGHLALRVYSDNVADFSIDQKVALAEYLYRLRDDLRAIGAPVEIEGVDGKPK